jgi:hypothetical protein
MGILRQAGTFRPVGGGWGGEAACGRSAAGGFRHGGITSGTVGSRSALRKCDAGRERSGNRSADPDLGHASDMPRRNASGANSGRLRPQDQREANPPLRTRQRTSARGHAAEGIRRFFATVPAVMSRRGIHLALPRRIVGTTAVRPCVRPVTANASGCGARPKRADSSDAWNIRPHGPNAVEIVSLAAA